MSDKHLLHAGFEAERYELYDDPDFRLEWDRREFLRALGGGILVCLVSHEVLAVQPAGQRRGRGFGGTVPQEIGAWIHIDEQGTGDAVVLLHSHGLSGRQWRKLAGELVCCAA